MQVEKSSTSKDGERRVLTLSWLVKARAVEEGGISNVQYTCVGHLSHRARVYRRLINVITSNLGRFNAVQDPLIHVLPSLHQVVTDSD
jgi:hypothetical protein